MSSIPFSPLGVLFVSFSFLCHSDPSTCQHMLHIMCGPRPSACQSLFQIVTLLPKKWKATMSELGKDARPLVIVGSVGNMSEERQGVDDDEARRDWRKLRELQSEGGVIHDQQDQAKARRTDRAVCANEGKPRYGQAISRTCCCVNTSYLL